MYILKNEQILVFLALTLFDTTSTLMSLIDLITARANVSTLVVRVTWRHKGNRLKLSFAYLSLN